MPELAELVRTTMPGRDIAVEATTQFDFLAEDYLDLFAAAGGTAFQHPIWLDAFYRRLARQRGATACVVTGRDRFGALVFAIPLILRRKSGVMLLETTDLGVSDYAAPPIRRNCQIDPAIADEIARVLPAHDVMRIRPVRDEHVADWEFLLGGHALRLDFSAHATRLSTSFESWRTSALDGSFQRMLERKKKRFLKQDGAQVRLLRERDEIAAAIASIADRRAGRFEGDLIQQEFVRDFYVEIATRGAPAGLARTYAIELGGEAIGHAFGITHAGRFNYLLIGCDYERHGRYSPGLLLYDAMIADWIEAGGRVFDFTIGDEAFKADFGTSPTPIYAVVASRTWRGRLATAAFDARAHLRRLRAPREAQPPQIQGE